MTSKKSKAQERAERTQQAMAEAKRRERRRNIINGGIVVAVIIAVVAAGFLLNRLQDDSGDVTASNAGNSEYGLVLGPADAPHQVVVYEDFLCPICGIFENTAGERLDELARSGAVQVDYRPISILGRFGPYSEQAANAFFVVREQASKQVADEFHDLLFADQPPESGPFPGTDWLVEKAVEAGAEEDAVREGIESGAQEDTVEAATEEATEAGVQGTPTILLDGEVFQRGSSWEDIADNLVAEIEES